MPSSGQFYLSYSRTCSAGRGQMCPNHIALLNNIFKDIPTVSFIEVKVEDLDVDSVLVVLVVHWQHTKTQSINSGRQKFRSPSIVQEKWILFLFPSFNKTKKSIPSMVRIVTKFVGAIFVALLNIGKIVCMFHIR